MPREADRKVSVDFEQFDDIVLAIVDRPPVNAIDSGVHGGLLRAAQRAVADDSIRALVIARRGSSWSGSAMRLPKPPRGIVS